jgi:hypothetical protein
MEVLQTSALPLGYGAKKLGGEGRLLTDSPPRAGNRTRTGDPNLGKVVLYQLSYSRMGRVASKNIPELLQGSSFSPLPTYKMEARNPICGCQPGSARADAAVVSPNPFAPLDFLPFFRCHRGVGPSTSLDIERKSCSGMNRLTPRFRPLAFGLVLSLGLASIALGLPSRGLSGQELPWLPRGQVRLDFAPSFWTWDSRYGRGPTGLKEVEPLGLDLTADPFGSSVLPDLEELEANIGLALDDPSYRVQLGVSQAFMDQSRLVIPFRLEVGVTDWLTVGAMVPLVRPRMEITFALDADSLTAADGTSPFVTDRTTVNQFLTALRGAVLKGEESFPGDEAVAAAAAYLDALTKAYSHGTFFPVLGSAPGLRLQERLDELRASFADLGLTGLPETVPLAGEYLDEEGFQEFLGGAFMRAYPLEDWTTLWSLGDVELTANARLLRGGFEPDSLGALPAFRFQLGGGVLVRLGTGGNADPARFFEQDAGDGQLDLEGNVFGLMELGSRLGFWGQIRYGIQKEGEVFRRITDPSQSLPSFARTAPLRWTPGNYLEADLNPRIFLNPALSFGVRYHFWSKGSDSYTLGAVDPELQDPANLPPAELLNLETEQKLQEIGLSATFSTVEAHARGDASMPLHVRVTYLRPMNGSGGRTPKGGRFQAGLTIYKTFWGRTDQVENQGEPGGAR